MDFKPTIVSFLCNWCSYTGADLAGTSRMKYKPNIRVIRVMCSGRVDPTFVLESFRHGADGVLICGCHPGDCHYNFGNFRGRRRIAIIKRILDSLGLDGERLWLRWVAHGEGKKMVDTAKEFNNYIIQKGVNPLSNRWDT